MDVIYLLIYVYYLDMYECFIFIHVIAVRIKKILTEVNRSHHLIRMMAMSRVSDCMIRNHPVPRNQDAMMNFPVAMITSDDDTSMQPHAFMYDEIAGLFNMKSPPFLHRGDACEGCLERFSVTRRKYHCGYCGRLLCAECRSGLGMCLR